MSIYKSFWSSEKPPTKEGKTTWAARMVDTGSVESFQYFDKDVTKIFTRSGDVFYIRYTYDNFEKIVLGYNDGYTKLFTFNNKN